MILLEAERNAGKIYDLSRHSPSSPRLTASRPTQLAWNSCHGILASFTPSSVPRLVVGDRPATLTPSLYEELTSADTAVMCF